MWSRSVSLDPIGSAGCYGGYLLLTVPLPWPSDISELPDVARVISQGKKRGIRVQAISSLDGAGSAILYRRHEDGSGFNRYDRSEVPLNREDSPAEAAEALLSQGRGRSEPTPHETVRDVLVCTHGRRDRCCGSFGTTLFLQLQARAERPAWSGVRLWRTSHTGGHRFAPTVLILPEGTLWAFMDVPSVEAVLAREGPTRALASSYRGCAGLAGPQAQVLERIALVDSGWRVLEAHRSSRVEDDGSHLLTCTWADGETAQWRGGIESHPVGPIPPCGGKPNDGDKWTSAWSAVVAPS